MQRTLKLRLADFWISRVDSSPCCLYLRFGWFNLADSTYIQRKKKFLSVRSRKVLGCCSPCIQVNTLREEKPSPWARAVSACAFASLCGKIVKRAIDRAEAIQAWTPNPPRTTACLVLHCSPPGPRAAYPSWPTRCRYSSSNRSWAYTGENFISPSASKFLSPAYVHNHL